MTDQTPNTAAINAKLAKGAAALAQELNNSQSDGLAFIAARADQLRPAKTPRAEFADTLYDAVVAAGVNPKWNDKTRKTRFRYAATIAEHFPTLDNMVTECMATGKARLDSVKDGLGKKLTKSQIFEKGLAELAKPMWDVDAGKSTLNAAWENARNAVTLLTNQKVSNIARAHQVEQEHGLAPSAMRVLSAITSLLTPSKDGATITMTPETYAAFVTVASVCAGVGIDAGLIKAMSDKGKAWDSRIPRTLAEGAGNISFADAKAAFDNAAITEAAPKPEPKPVASNATTPAVPTAPDNVDALLDLLMMRMQERAGK